MTKVVAIKTFFGMDAKTAMAEIKELKENPRDFDEIGDMCLAALGQTE